MLFWQLPLFLKAAVCAFYFLLRKNGSEMWNVVSCWFFFFFFTLNCVCEACKNEERAMFSASNFQKDDNLQKSNHKGKSFLLFSGDLLCIKGTLVGQRWVRETREKGFLVFMLRCVRVQSWGNVLPVAVVKPGWAAEGVSKIERCGKIRVADSWVDYSFHFQVSL